MARAWPLTLVAPLLLLAAAAAGYDESAAPTLRPDVLSAWHEPATVRAGEPWKAFLQLRPESNVTAVLFQVCRVGQACFNPPTPAHALGNGTFAFDAAEVAPNGRAIAFGAGWRVGVRWHLREGLGNASRTVAFPPSPSCADEAALSCQEQHYLAFNVAADSPSAPAPAAVIVAVALLVLAGRRRHA